MVRIYGSKWGLVLAGSGVRCLNASMGWQALVVTGQLKGRGWRQGTMRTLFQWYWEWKTSCSGNSSGKPQMPELVSIWSNFLGLKCFILA